MGELDPIRAEDPGGPEDPADPKEPAKPEKPADPKEPTKPDDPKEPAEPEEPDDPEEPAEPEEPEEPAEPEEPDDPEESAEEDISLASISISSPPEKSVYVRGEDLDLQGLEITGTYSDGTSRIEEINSEYVSGYDKTKAGAQTVTISLEGKTADFTVTVYVTELSVSLGWPEEGSPIITGFPDGIVCSRTESGGLVREFILNIEGYKLTECWVGSKKIKITAQGFLINAADYAAKEYSITCIGMKGDLPFLMELPFIVVE
jgi:hypothetical protein